MSNTLEGKIAVVTGGTSGIGLATAKAFVALGAKVIITGRKKAEVEKTAIEMGATGIVCDQAKLPDIDHLVAAVKTGFGSVDILFINAGIVLFSSIEDATEEHFDQLMNINFKGAVFTIEKFLPILAEGASVIGLSSISAYVSALGAGIYSASKAALNAYVRTVAGHLAERHELIARGPVHDHVAQDTYRAFPWIDNREPMM